MPDPIYVPAAPGQEIVILWLCQDNPGQRPVLADVADECEPVVAWKIEPTEDYRYNDGAWPVRLCGDRIITDEMVLLPMRNGGFFLVGDGPYASLDSAKAAFLLLRQHAWDMKHKVSKSA